MNKAVSVAVLLALASASEDFSDNNLNLISKVKEDLKKAGHFIVEHPQIITTAVKILAKDDEIADSELNAKDVFKKIGQGLLTGVKIASKFLDDETADQELFHIPKPTIDVKVHFDENGNELNVISKMESGAKKVAGFVADHPELVSTIAKIIANKDEITDDELNFLSKVKEDLKKAGHFVAEHPEIITTAIKLIKDDEVADEELFKIPVPKVDIGIHFDENGNELFRTIPGHSMQFDDEELFKIPKPTIEAKIHFDEAADAELNAKDVFKKIGQGLLTGVKIASKFLDDETADQELFKIPKPTIDVKVHFDENENELFRAIPGHSMQFDDEELFKIPKPKVDIGIHFDENGNELFHIPKPTIEAKIHFDEQAENELFAPRHNQTQHHGAVKKAQKDVKNASELLRKLHNLHHQRNSTQHDSLSNLGQLLHEGRQLHHNQHHRNATEVHDHNLSIKDKLKKAAGWIGDHPQVISETAKAIKTLKGK